MRGLVIAADACLKGDVGLLDENNQLFNCSTIVFGMAGGR